MTLGHRIKTCRLAANLSQEQVAEKVGVSRQAVTKWETDLSAPSTENLFKLAELFNTTVDFLLEDEKPEPVPGHKYTGLAGAVHDGLITLADRIERHYILEEESVLRARKQRRRKYLLSCLAVLLFYLLVYLMGRYLWCRSGVLSIFGFLWGAEPVGPHSYLFGWLLHQKLFLYSMLLSFLLALFKRPVWAAVSCGGFLIGFAAGVIFGPNPAGAAIGQGHYGWAIWGGIFLLSIIGGFIAEKLYRKRQKV